LSTKESVSADLSVDRLEKFGYRQYDGEIQDRKSRILSLIIFEVKSTWQRSTFGKVMLIIILVINFVLISVFATITNAVNPDLSPEQQDEAVRDTLNNFVAEYLSIGDNYVRAGVLESGFDLTLEMGFLLIVLFAVAGSGLFADDRQGRVIEIYLSRLTKREYIIGKIGAIMIYLNLFIMMPLLVLGILDVQSISSTSHLEQWDFYAGLILFSLLSSLIIGMAILSFSVIVEKRAYASLGFFMTYIIGTILGSILTDIDSSNEFLILVSPSNLLMLLAYLCLGDFKLGIFTGRDANWEPIIEPLLLNDGHGLEYYHIIAVTVLLITSLVAFLGYKIRKLTTEEL
jgi:hypothetical protein